MQLITSPCALTPPQANWGGNTWLTGMLWGQMVPDVGCLARCPRMGPPWASKPQPPPSLPQCTSLPLFHQMYTPSLIPILSILLWSLVFPMASPDLQRAHLCFLKGPLDASLSRIKLRQHLAPHSKHLNLGVLPPSQSSFSSSRKNALQLVWTNNP